MRMSSALKLVTLALLSVDVSCLPDPDPGTHHFTKTGRATEKGGPSYDLKKGNIEKSVGNNIMLVGGGSNKEGNVLLNGKPICDYKWDDRDAKVVCRMLGFSSDGAFATIKSQFGLVSREDFIMYDVQCKGAESDVRDCYHRANHNCGAGEGAGVRCRVSPSDDDLKEELEEVKDENEELQTKLSALMTKQDSELRALRTKLDGLSQNLTELGSKVNFDENVFGDLITAFNDSLTSLTIKTASNSKNIEGISTVVDNVTEEVVNLKTSDKQQETRIVDNIQKLNSLKTSDQKQETRIVDNTQKLNSVSRHGKWCALQSGWGTANSIIKYESLKFSSSNMEITGTPLNISTGIFTVPVSGVWRVTTSILFGLNAGKYTRGYIYFNDKQLPESLHYNENSVAGSSGRMWSTGGREVSLAATAGDTIYFKTTSMTDIYNYMYFCVAFEHGLDHQTRFSARDENIPGPEYQDDIPADVEDILRPEYQDSFPAYDEDISGPKYQDHSPAGDEEYFSADLDKSVCSSNADCPPHLACIRSVLSSDPGTCGDPWCWREEWDCGSGARCIIANHKPLCV